MPKIKLLSPWRRKFQWTTTLAIILLPWFRTGGESLLRIDMESLSLHVFGQVLRIEELYLMLFLCLALVLGFLLITLVFGRVWCGWACPQTTLNDIAEWLAKTLKLKVTGNKLEGALWRKSLIQTCYFFLAFLVAANLLWYFIEPRQFFHDLANADLHLAAWATLLIVFATVYIDLAFIRRIMCSDFCPYGRIQTSLVDPGTLTLHIPDSEIGRCIECRSCVRVCPMEIDIREGYQVECINCGRCLDACRKVMAPRQEQGLICYSFGLENKGAMALLNPRTMLIALATLGILLILIVATFNRTEATLKISRSHHVAERLLADGRQATFFNAWINNRTSQEIIFFVEAFEQPSEKKLQLKGQTRQIILAGGGNQRIDFVLVSTPPETEQIVKFILRGTAGVVYDETPASVSPLEN